MPIILTLNGDNHGTIAETVVINQYPAQAQKCEVEDVVVVEQETPAAATAPAPDLDKFRALLTVPYLNRKRECDAMLDLLTQEGYNKKDRARMALALYQSGNVALKREHITTFRQWWRICCELLHWQGADTCYRTAELTENEITKQIRSYM